MASSSTAARISVADPQVNSALNNIQNSLNQLASQLAQLQALTKGFVNPAVKAGVYVMAVGTKITVNALGQITLIQ
jgi:cob(I)alamin adenosyltransferase